MTRASADVFDGATRIGGTLPFVKVCGLTRAVDVRLAVHCGASAVGFVLWPNSPRAVTASGAARLREALPAGVRAVGVFVDATPAEIADAVRTVGLDAVQLHGDEPFAVRDTIHVPIIKAIVGGAHDAEWLAYDGAGMIALVDARDTARRGGTGLVADWDAARTLAAARPLVLAGGLRADNVAAAIHHVRPFAIDVSSGVETAPGLKDEQRMQAFFAALRSVEGMKS